MSQTHVIALHCSGGSAGQWQHLKRMLPGHVSLWCPHFIGSTWAGHWSGNHAFTLADEAAAIVSMIDAIGRPVHLVGHSYGGGVALRVARERPGQIASMALYEPTALHLLRTAGPDAKTALDEINAISAAVDRAILAGDHRAAARQFVEYWSEPGTWGRMRNEAQADVIHYMPKACLDFRALLLEPTPLTVYRHFRFPVLLLQGQQTREPTQVIARRLAKALRFGSLQTVDGAGHMGPLTHAETVAALIAGFVERQDSNADASGDAGLTHGRAA